MNIEPHSPSIGITYLFTGPKSVAFFINPINTGIQKLIPEKNDQRKMYNISRSLSERLRKYAFDERRKEVDIVREALDDWLKKQGY